jgi:hypothetical protein
LTISLSTAGGAVRIGLDGPGVSYDPATGLYTTELAALADGITLSVSAVDAEGTAFGPFVLQLQALDAADDGGAPGEPPAEPSAEAPALIEAPVLAGEPRVGRTLTVSAGTWSGDPVPAITCQWLRNGTPVAGATGEDYRLGAADDRASIACRVTATNSAGSANAETGAVPVVRAAPRAVGTLPDVAYVQGTGPRSVEAAGAFAGDALVFSVNGAGATIDPGTGRITLPTVSVIAGTSVVVRARNSGGTVETSFRVSVAAAQVAPSVVAAPTISGSGRIGTPLALSPGVWAGEPSPSLGFAWLRGGTPIAGATGASYTPVEADDRQSISVRVTATNAAGSASAVAGPVTVTRPAPRATGTLADVRFTQGSGAQFVPAGPAFDGSGLVYTVAGTGATIDAATGMVRIATANAISAATVVVTATNSGGTAQVSFRVSVVAAAQTATVAPSAYLPWMQPVYFVTGMGVRQVNGAERFSGDGLTYQVSNVGSTGITINPASGVLSVPTGAAFPWREVTITATNSLGSAQVTLEIWVFTPNHVLSGGAAFSTISPRPGDIVVVRAGTYRSRQNVAGWSGASAAAPTRIVAYPGETVTFDASSLTGTDILGLRSADNIEIRGFRFVDDGGVNWAFFGEGAENVTVAQCDISGFRRGAMCFDYVAKSTNAGWRVEYNRLHNNVLENRKADGTGGQRGTSGWGRAIFGDFRGGSVIRRNWVYENYGEGIGLLANSGSRVTENIVWDNYSVMIYADNTARATVQNNIVFHTGNTRFFRSSRPAQSIVFSNETYGESKYDLATTGNIATGNRILSGMTTPAYWSGGGGLSGSGTSVFAPNSTIAAYSPRWLAAVNPWA